MKHATVSENYRNSPACCEEFLEECLVQAPDPEDTRRVVIPVLLGPLDWKYPSAVPDDKICLGPGKSALGRFPEATKEQLLGQFGTRNAFPNPNDGLLFDNPETNLPKLISLIEAAIENPQQAQACPSSSLSPQSLYIKCCVGTFTGSLFSNSAHVPYLPQVRELNTVHSNHPTS